MNHPPVLPSFNLNGTDPDQISAEYFEVLKACVGLRQALEKATCHGRDFPEWESFNLAREDRLQVLHNLKEIHQYAEAWMYHAQDESAARQSV